jgi:hypothetical protein
MAGARLRPRGSALDNLVAKKDYAHRLNEVQKHLVKILIEFSKCAICPATKELLESSGSHFFYLFDCLAGPDLLWSNSLW